MRPRLGSGSAVTDDSTDVTNSQYEGERSFFDDPANKAEIDAQKAIFDSQGWANENESNEQERTQRNDHDVVKAGTVHDGHRNIEGNEREISDVEWWQDLNSNDGLHGENKGDLN